MGPSIPTLKLEEINRNDSVLVDGQSILTCHGWMAGQLGQVSDLDSKAFCNLIQNLVIYDHVLVDSQLLLVNQECREVCENFPEVFRAVRLPSSLRNEIVRGLQQVNLGDVVPVGSALPAAELIHLTQGDLEGPEHYQMIGRFSRSSEAPDEEAREYEYGHLHPALCQTGFSLLRTHFYLELARKQELFLSAHPYRAEYFKRLKASVREKIVSTVDKEMVNSPAAAFVDVDVTIPPVAAWILQISQAEGVDLEAAIRRARESGDCRKFREWCTKLQGEMRAGRAGFKTAQKIARELQEVCTIWKSNVDEQVRYVTRQINLSALPILGAVLTAFGLEKRTIKDPVLAVDKPYLLFLNDLYQPWKVKH